MELAGIRVIPAASADVWRALNDVDCLRASIPGCEALERTADNAYDARVTVRIGPVVATFNGQVTMLDIDAPNGYTLRFEGQGGAAGFASGDANVSLAAAEDGATSLSYAVRAQIGGKLAQIGSRLIDGVASKLAEEFFTRFAALFVALAPSAIAEPLTASAAPPPASAQPAAATAQAPSVPARAPSVRAPTPAATSATAAPLRARGGSAWTRYVAIAAILALMAILYYTGGHFR